MDDQGNFELLVTLVTGTSFVMRSDGRDAHNIAASIVRGTMGVSDVHGNGETTYYPASQVASVTVRLKATDAA